MAYIKMSSFALRQLLTGDELIIALANGKNAKIPLTDLRDFFGVGTVTAFKGALAIADPAPSENGIYVPTESGTYTNFGGEVVDLTDGVVFLIKDGADFKQAVFPINLSNYLAKDYTGKGGLNFASGNGAVSFPGYNMFPGASWSIEMLIKITDSAAVQCVMLNGTGNPTVYINAGNLVVAKSGVIVTLNIPIPGAWINKSTFISIVYNAGTYTVKANNVGTTANVSAADTYAGSDNPIYFGGYEGTSQFFTGELSMFRVYNYALTAPEGTAHYNGGYPLEAVAEKIAGLTFELIPENLSPTQWFDSSAGANVGTIMGGAKPAGTKAPEIKPDLINNKSGVTMAGLGNAVSPASSYFPNAAGTIEVALKLTDISAVQVIFFNGTDNPIIYTNSGTITFGSANIGGVLSFDGTPFLNKKRLLTITYNGSTYAVYMDGVLISHTLILSRTFAGGVQPLTLGSQNGSAGLSGDVYMFRISNFALSAGQVLSRWNKGLIEDVVLLKDSTIILELQGKNATSTKWFDSSKNGLHAVMQGTQTTFSTGADQTAGVAQTRLAALPSKIYVAVGREFNLWFDSLIPYYGKDVRINVTCAKGACMERSFRYTPTTTETTAMTVTVKNLNGEALESRVISLIAVSKTAGTGTKQMLFIGDSTTDSYLTDYLGTGRAKYEMLLEFMNLVTTDGGITPKLLGTNGVAPILHEGHSGWSTGMFLTTGSPFWDGTRVNFKTWMSSNSNFGGADRIDFVFIQLGINDLKYNADAQTAINGLKSLVDKINDATYGYPGAKIIISQTPYACADRTGWATAFVGANDSDWEAYVHNMVKYAALIVANFHENGAYPNVYVAPNMLFVDRYYGFPRALAAVSNRSAEQIEQFTDSVHPDNPGYKQAADSYYSRMRSLL